MIQAKDLALDQYNDLRIANGDFNIDYSDVTHIKHIVYSYTGYWRNAPRCGVGIEQYLKSNADTTDVKRALSIQLMADSYEVKSIDIKLLPTLAININAERIK